MKITITNDSNGTIANRILLEDFDFPIRKWNAIPDKQRIAVPGHAMFHVTPGLIYSVQRQPHSLILYKFRERSALNQSARTDRFHDDALRFLPEDEKELPKRFVAFLRSSKVEVPENLEILLTGALHAALPKKERLGLYPKGAGTGLGGSQRR